MQSGVLNQGAIDATNIAQDPRATNPLKFRSTGTLETATIDGTQCIKATRATTGSMQVVVDKRYYSDVEGFKVGDKIFWSADIRVTAPADIQLQVTFFAGGNEDTAAAITPQTPAQGWVRHYGVSTITANPTGSYFEYRIHTVGANIPAGQGFYFRNLAIVRNKDVPYFDGSTPSNSSFTYGWLGAPDASSAVRRLATSDDVIPYTAKVLVNGVQREVLSWSLDREITSDMPDQVAGGNGVAQATGNVEWAGEDVEDGRRTPWDKSAGWLPLPGDDVKIIVSDGANEWSRGVMRVDDTSGSIGGGISSPIIDHYDDLSAAVNVPALLAHMPPVEDSGPWRRVGLSTHFYTQEALRAGGFYATPKPEFGAVMYAHGQGSMWPSIGQCVSCSKVTDTSLAPSVFNAPWGTAVSNIVARFKPSFARGTDANLQMTMMVAPDHAGLATFDAMYGSTRIRLQVGADRAVQAQYGTTTIASMTSASFAGSTIVTLLVKGGVWTLRGNKGGTGTGSQSLTGVTATLSEIVITAASENARISAFQVSHPTASVHEFSSLNFESTANVLLGGLGVGNAALPAFESTPAVEALETLAKAKLQPFWIDELGVAQVVASDQLLSRSPVRALTGLNDIFELSWKMSYLSVRSKVVAKYQQPSIVSRANSSVEVWSSSSADVLASGEVSEEFISTPDDESWILVDEVPHALGGSAIPAEVNRGIGTLLGGIYTNGTTEEWAVGGNNLTVGLERIGPSAWKATSTAQNVAAGYQVELRTLSPEYSGTTDLWPRWWDRGLPIIRAKARVQWMNRERTPNIAGTSGPELVLDLGPWATGFTGVETSGVDAISSFVAEQVAAPHPVIEGLKIAPDPRLQVGDVVTVTSTRLSGVILRCLILGISESFGSNGYEMDLRVRVIDVTATQVTYEDFTDAWPDTADYQSFAAAWETISTYQDFDNDPLRGTN